MRFRSSLLSKKPHPATKIGRIVHTNPCTVEGRRDKLSIFRTN